MRYLSEKDNLMKGLYKLAVAFEKASQNMSVKPPSEPNFTQDPNAPFGPPAPPKAKPQSGGNGVMALQQCLINLGFPLPRKGADGIMGDETIRAINAFKARYDLTGASPSAVQARIHSEADKLLLAPTEKSNSIAFAIPGSPDAASNPAGPPGSPIGPVGDHKVPGSISAQPTAKKNTGNLIKDLL